MATVDISRSPHMDFCSRAGFLQLDLNSLDFTLYTSDHVVPGLCYLEACGLDYSSRALQCLQPDGSSVQQLGTAQSGHKQERFH